MARMLGDNYHALPVGHGTGNLRKCFGGCPDGCGWQPDKQTQRAREKRSVARWAQEYDDPPPVLDRACPKGGPDCGCHHYLPGDPD